MNSAQVPRWDQLRTIGGLSALRASYLAILVVPLAAEDNAVTRALGLDAGYRMRLSYFAAVSVLLGKLIYDLRCPPPVRRFESALSMHESMVEVEAQAVALGQTTSVDSRIEVCDEKYSKAVNQHLASRLACSLSFLVSSVLAIIILLERSLTVLLS
ncbi:MAG: hypothetical protein GY701_31055 [Sulfitobacter sp.]|nr:hypothetical protein [Sulfitobacter sp.]